MSNYGKVFYVYCPVFSQRIRARSGATPIGVPCVTLLLLISFAMIDCAAGVEPRMPTDNDLAGHPIETAPPGYPSIEAFRTAVQNEEIKMANREIRVTAEIQRTEGIVYGKGGDIPLKLDLYSPRVIKKPVPALIVIHGGSWVSGQRSEYHYHCVKLAQRGYVVATISYRFVPEFTHPAAVNDSKCAVRWMRANSKRLHVNPEQIAVIGFSAGGHLAMMVGYSANVPELEGDGGNKGVSSRVQAVINFYGPTDLTTSFLSRTDMVIDYMDGKKYDDARKQYRQASPLTHVSEDDPPTLIFHGSIDDVIPISQADALAEALRGASVPFRYDRLVGWPHGVDYRTDKLNRRCMQLTFEFLDQYLPLPN